MPAQRYSQYFNIDEKYYAVVTKELIDEGKVRWEGFYPHETFIQLLHQVVTMLSGKETKSIWVEGTYGTGKSHATLEMPDIRRKGHHEAEIYDGGVKITMLTFETKRQTGTNQLI